MGGQVLLVCLLAALGVGVKADLAVMTDVTLGFGQALEHCRVETGLTEEKMEEFFHFWSEEFNFEQRELGCALRCMSKYFNLITDENKMHHANTEKFIKKFPNGEVLAEQLVVIIHECEKQAEHEEDHCLRILLIAKCFRDTCRSRNLAPTMEMLMAEFIMQTEQ